LEATFAPRPESSTADNYLLYSGLGDRPQKLIQNVKLLYKCKQFIYGLAVTFRMEQFVRCHKSGKGC